MKKLWEELLEIAKTYHKENKYFYSKTKRGVYKIKSYDKDKIVIKKFNGIDEVLTKNRLFSNIDKLIYGTPWKISSCLKTFLLLHPKIKEENGNLKLVNEED
ncbi:hypothetical protein [Methanocaldococcus infernus]